MSHPVRRAPAPHRRALTALPAMVLLAACAGSKPAAPASTPPAAAAPAARTATGVPAPADRATPAPGVHATVLRLPSPGETAPSLALTDVATGERWSLQDQIDPTGESCPKGVLVAFMASWCTYCTQGLPALVAAEKANPDLAVVTVTVDGSDDTRKAELDKVRKAGLTGPVLAADAQTVSQWIGGGKSVPKYYFVDHDGVVSARDDGYTDDLGSLLAKQATHALAN